jgi:hypothetical protein
MSPDKIEEVRRGIYDMYVADGNWNTQERPALIRELAVLHRLDYLKTYDLIFKLYMPRRAVSDGTGYVRLITDAHILSLDATPLVPRSAPSSLHKKRRPSLLKVEQNGNDAPRRKLEFNKKRTASV